MKRHCAGGVPVEGEHYTLDKPRMVTPYTPTAAPREPRCPSLTLNPASGIRRYDSLEVGEAEVGELPEVTALICWLATEEASFSTAATFRWRGAPW
jgi:hypothetical protein